MVLEFLNGFDLAAADVGQQLSVASAVECAVQVRAHGGIADAVAEVRNGELLIALRAPLRGVAPGQTMVLYRTDADGDEVIGSATITRAE